MKQRITGRDPFEEVASWGYKQWNQSEPATPQPRTVHAILAKSKRKSAENEAIT
jgi:hypothetical protein